MRARSQRGTATAAAPRLHPSIARQRNAILATLLAFAVAGWIVFLNQARQPMHDEHGMMPGPDLTMGRSAPLFLGMWVAMMAAMMFPAAAPMVLMYRRVQQEPVAIGLFAGSYIVLWFVFGAVLYLLGVLVEVSVSRSAWVGMHWGRAGGLVLAAAGLYQLTPLKGVCLRQCRAPVAFVMMRWRPGNTGAMRMGLEHSLYCMGCCWLLFLILVPLGVMNVGAMIAVSLIVFAEKVMPWGKGAGRLAALGLVVYGALVMLRPALLPTVA